MNEKENLELEIEKIKKELEECQKLKNEYLAGWQKARADFLNYKKEEMERIIEFFKYSNEELILKLLPIMDSFERAEKIFLKNNLEEENNQIIQGFFQIKRQLEEFLKNQKVEEIKIKENETFNPNFEEVVEEVKVANEEEENKIIEVVEKGYKLHDKVIRPAKVKIGKK